MKAMPMKMNSRVQKIFAGFSLLELLVVIAILGILITIGAVAFSTAQQRGRDAKRRGDIRALQSAYEQFYSENSDYASSCGNLDNPQQAGGTDYFPGGQPRDPKSNDLYECNHTTDTYCVCALLESSNGNATDDLCTYGSGEYYCLSNLQ